MRASARGPVVGNSGPIVLGGGHRISQSHYYIRDITPHVDVDSVGRRRSLVVSPDGLSTPHVSSVLFGRISVHEPLHYSFFAHTDAGIRSVWVAVRLSRSRAHRAAPID